MSTCNVLKQHSKLPRYCFLSILQSVCKEFMIMTSLDMFDALFDTSTGISLKYYKSFIDPP
jgi:hypothetical protein